jgi:hypothetical protein
MKACPVGGTSCAALLLEEPAEVTQRPNRLASGPAGSELIDGILAHFLRSRTLRRPLVGTFSGAHCGRSVCKCARQPLDGEEEQRRTDV